MNLEISPAAPAQIEFMQKFTDPQETMYFGDFGSIIKKYIFNQNFSKILTCDQSVFSNHLNNN